MTIVLLVLFRPFFRSLVLVVLLVCYKFDGKLYVVMFYDDDAVDFLNQYAEVVGNVKVQRNKALNDSQSWMNAHL